MIMNKSGAGKERKGAELGAPRHYYIIGIKVEKKQKFLWGPSRGREEREKRQVQYSTYREMLFRPDDYRCFYFFFLTIIMFPPTLTLSLFPQPAPAVALALPV